MTGQRDQLDPALRQRAPRALVPLHVRRLVPRARENRGGVDVGGGGRDGGGVFAANKPHSAAAVPAPYVPIQGVQGMVQPHPRRLSRGPGGALVVPLLVRGPDEEAEHLAAPPVRGANRGAKRLVVVQPQILTKPHHRASGRGRLGRGSRRVRRLGNDRPRDRGGGIVGARETTTRTGPERPRPRPMAQITRARA